MVFDGYCNTIFVFSPIQDAVNVKEIDLNVFASEAREVDANEKISVRGAQATASNAANHTNHVDAGRCPHSQSFVVALVLF